MVKEETRKNSLLRLINDIGGGGRHREFCKRIRDYWELTDEEKRNEKKLFHHVASIEQALKASDFLTLEGNIWKITDEGKKHLSSMSHATVLHGVVSKEQSTMEDLPLCKKLRETQRNSDDPTLFEKALVQAFDAFGFSAKHIGGRDEPDVFINDKFNIILDSKTTKEQNNKRRGNKRAIH